MLGTSAIANLTFRLENRTETTKTMAQQGKVAAAQRPFGPRFRHKKYLITHVRLRTDGGTDLSTNYLSVWLGPLGEEEPIFRQRSIISCRKFQC